MQTILATGGTGYIGSHTCVELLKKEFKVIILDSLINSSSKVFEKIIKITERNNPEFAKNCSFIKVI